MRRTRPQDRLRPQEPGRCTCHHVTDTPEWTGHRGAGAGLTTRHGAKHGDPFKRTGSCQHSELQRTTEPRRKVVAILRIRP